MSHHRPIPVATWPDPLLHRSFTNEASASTPPTKKHQNGRTGHNRRRVVPRFLVIFICCMAFKAADLTRTFPDTAWTRPAGTAAGPPDAPGRNGRRPFATMRRSAAPPGCRVVVSDHRARTVERAENTRSSSNTSTRASASGKLPQLRWQNHVPHRHPIAIRPRTGQPPSLPTGSRQSSKVRASQPSCQLGLLSRSAVGARPNINYGRRPVSGSPADTKRSCTWNPRIEAAAPRMPLAIRRRPTPCCRREPQRAHPDEGTRPRLCPPGARRDARPGRWSPMPRRSPPCRSLRRHVNGTVLVQRWHQRGAGRPRPRVAGGSGRGRSSDGDAPHHGVHRVEDRAAEPVRFEGDLGEPGLTEGPVGVSVQLTSFEDPRPRAA